MNAAAAEVLTADPNGATPVASAPLTTFEQWANMDEDEPGEFVDGRIVEEEVPSHVHEIIVSWLIRILGNWGAPRGYQVFGSEHKLRVARDRGRKPDVCMYSQGTRVRDAAFSRKPPMLIVEVVSRLPRDVKRDRHEKRQEYAKFGVQHYWLVDPYARVIEFLACEPKDGRYSSSESASEGQVDVAGFDGLVLDFDQLWAEVDAFIGDDEESIIEDNEG